MTRQTLPYPTWPVFWGFTLCSVLSGVAFVFPKEFSLPFGHSGALETSIIVAIILTPIAILASIFIILFQTYREKIGILTSMLICIASGILFAVLILNIFTHEGIELVISVSYSVAKTAIFPAFITSLIALPPKPTHTESEDSP